MWRWDQIGLTWWIKNNMLYVFFGSDTEAVRRAGYAKLDDLRSAYPEVAINKLDSAEYQIGQLASLSATTSLFGGVEAYLIDTPEENLDYKGELLLNGEILASSPAHFIVMTGSLLVAEKKALASALELEEFKSTGTERFDAFKLADALARRDKRGLWVLLQDARQANLATEEIIGVLWWQLKTLRLALITKTATEAGVKDFPYNKAKKSLVNFKPGEVAKLSNSLLKLYHDGHAGKREIDLALEEWVLKL